MRKPPADDLVGGLVLLALCAVSGGPGDASSRAHQHDLTLRLKAFALTASVSNIDTLSEQSTESRRDAP